MTDQELLLSAITNSSLPDREGEAVTMLAAAYRDLLAMPHGGVRARNQAVFASLRDALAAELHIDPETVQNGFAPA